MNSKYEINSNVVLSLCDNTSHLSVPSIFTLFMDIATMHADELKVSADDLGDNLFWITVRTKVKIDSRPELSENITLSTWPERPGRVRANRHYQISSGDKVYISGKSEWTVLNVESGKLQRLSDVYPESYEFCDELAVEESYVRMSDDFSESDAVATYTVRSTDIDLVQHMNNAAYIRALMGIFTTKELSDRPIKEIEIMYKAQSYEGETLTVKARESDGATEYGIIKEDGSVSAIVRVVR